MTSTAMFRQLPSIVLRGIPLHALSEAECIRVILSAIDQGEGGWVVTPNLDILRRCECDSAFRELVLQADLRVADGMPLIWASRLQQTPLPERIAGSTLIRTLSEAAAVEGRSIFLLGGNPVVRAVSGAPAFPGAGAAGWPVKAASAAQLAAHALRESIPRLRMAGVTCPPFGFEQDEYELDQMRQRLLEARPDIVFVGLGSPKQEKLIAQLREVLPRSWWLGVGVSFSFLCGEVRRAPHWMQRSGLEWAHRLVQQPHQLCRRYLFHGVPYAFRLLGGAMWSRLLAATSLAAR